MATGATSDLAVDGFFLAIGHRPNTAPFEGWLAKDEKGYLVVEHETHSPIEGVFIAGDVHDHRYRQAITAAGDGCRAAIDAERWLEEHGAVRGRRPRRHGERSPRGDTPPARASYRAQASWSAQPSAARLRGPRRRATRQGAASPAVVVLDAGCGRSSALARHRARIGRFVGALTSTSRRPAALPYLDEFAAVDLCVSADAFPPAPSTGVLSSFTVEHFADPDAAFANLARWLRPGGSLVLTTVNRRHPFVAAYLEMPDALRRRIQPLVKATVADAHPLVGACNEPAAVRAALARAGFVDVRLAERGPPRARLGTTPPDLRPRARRRPARAGHPDAPLDPRRHGPHPGARRMTGRGAGGARRLARAPLGGAELPPSLPPERRRRTIIRIAAFFRPYRLQVAVVFGAILVTSLLGLVNPIMLKLLTDQVIIGQDYTHLLLFVGLMIVTPIISGLIGVGQTYLNNVIGQSVMQDLRNALYSHLQRLPLRFFTETRTGEIQSRLSNDVGGVQAVVTDTARAWLRTSPSSSRPSWRWSSSTGG